MSVLSQDVGRKDIILHRGVQEKIGAQWKQRLPGKTEFQPVDLSKDSAKLNLYNYSGNPIYTKQCQTFSNGCAIATIPDDALTTWALQAEQIGTWRIECNHNGARILLGHGNYEITT